jgi:hypothetical protein
MTAEYSQDNGALAQKTLGGNRCAAHVGELEGWECVAYLDNPIQDPGCPEIGSCALHDRQFVWRDLLRRASADLS